MLSLGRSITKQAASTAVAQEGEKAVPAEGTMFKSPVFKVLDFLFTIPVVHDLMFGIYRKQVVEKSEKMGLPWTDFMDEQWEALPKVRILGCVMLLACACRSCVGEKMNLATLFNLSTPPI